MIETKEKLTPWFRPDQKPARDGIYRAQDTSMRCRCCWIELEWRGGEWFSETHGHNVFATHFFTSRLRRWRGLAERPSTGIKEQSHGS